MKPDQIKEWFARPGREFGPTPFFGLNDELDPDRLRWALREFADKGAAGVFMHARTGLLVPYLSETWWDRVGVIVEECERLSLKAWIYDEYNWPSGVAGGLLLEKHPEYIMPFLDFENIKVNEDEEIRHRGAAIAAFEIGGRVKDLTEHVRDGRFDPPAEYSGEVLLFFTDLARDANFAVSNAPWVGKVPGYVDLMNEKAVEAFMDLTHREYQKRLFRHFGKTIPGLFTDEPQFYRGFPWTADLPDRFREDNGYDLVPQLFSLVHDRENYRRVRCDFYRLVERLYAGRYFKRVRDWCAGAGLIFTGHLGMEERLSELPSNQGGVYLPLKYMHLPGIDALGHGNPVAGGLVNMESPWFSPRAARSISKIHADGQVLCENGGGSGWEATPASLKAQLDWLFASGVTFVNPHQSLLSVKGLRKRDFPPSNFVQEPWWELYGIHSNYISRMSQVLAGSEPLVDLALLFPLDALRAGHRGRSVSARKDASHLLVPLDSIAGFLLENQRDFDVLFEEAVEDGAVKAEGGVVRAGKYSYRAVLVPPCDTLSRAAAVMLKDLCDGGGRVVFFDALPRFDEKGESIGGLLLEPFKKAMGEGRAAWFSSQKGFSSEGILSALDKLCPPRFELEGDDKNGLALSARQIEGAALLFIANLDGAEREVTLKLEKRPGRFERLDPVTGENELMPVGKSGDAGLIALAFGPGESFVYLAHESGEDAADLTASNLSGLFKEGGKFRGHTAESKGVIVIGGRRVEEEGGPVPLPLILRPEWEIELEGKNVFLLGPWDVRARAMSSAPHSALADEPHFTPRTRSIARIGRAAVSALRVLHSPEKRYRTEPYFDFGDTERMTGPVSKLTGLDLFRLGVYGGSAAMSRLADFMGVTTLLRSFPPPGVEFTAKTSFDLAFVPQDLVLVFEDLGEPFTFTLNGKRLESAAPVSAWDPCCQGFDIRGLCRPGKNILVYSGRQVDFPALPPNIHSLEPAALLGDFAVKKGKVTAPDRGPGGGELVARGFPRYSGAARLSCRFWLPGEFLDYRLTLEIEDLRECAEVFINGNKVGARAYPPYRFPISGWCREGENEMTVRVFNTAVNFFGRPEPAGVMGAVKIIATRKYELGAQ